MSAALAVGSAADAPPQPRVIVPPRKPLGIDPPAAGTPMLIMGGAESTSTVIEDPARDTPVVVLCATSSVQIPSASAMAVLNAPDPETEVLKVVVGIAPTEEPRWARTITDDCIDAAVDAVPARVNPVSSGSVAAMIEPEGPKVAAEGAEIVGRVVSTASERVVVVVETWARVG